VTEFDHISVLPREVVEYIAPRAGGRYCDGTLGGAGHAASVLAASAPDGQLIGIDRDPDALAAARARLSSYGDRVTTVHGTFGAVAEILAGLGVTQVDGLLLDLGISSPQLDRAERGFSFSHPGPIDMRMDPTQGPTALDLVRDTPVDDLGRIIADYGEERYARRIARRLKDAVHDDKLATTADVAAVIASCIPAAEQRKSRIHPATRTFQALRIAVNGELDELERFLAIFPDLLAPGGRCVIISFHSLEDRMVKNRFRDLAWSSSLPPRLAIQAGERVDPVCVPVTRKAVFAADDEIASNPRARSARLRACEKFVAAPRQEKA
jgi:16S rRNA (cytosine1402-N4)-methyltransferase